MKDEITHLQMGKNGLSEGFIGQAKKIFETEKAIKITLLKSSTRNRSEAEEMAKKLVAALGENYQYHLIGWTLVVKRRRHKI